MFARLPVRGPSGAPIGCCCAVFFPLVAVMRQQRRFSSLRLPAIQLLAVSVLLYFLGWAPQAKGQLQTALMGLYQYRIHGVRSHATLVSLPAQCMVV